MTANNQRQMYYNCYVDNGNIIYLDPYSTNRGGTVIGVISDIHNNAIAELNDLRDTVDRYYNKLVELGAIVVPKTPEQISNAINEVFEKILTRLEKLEQKEVVKDNECN